MRTFLSIRHSEPRSSSKLVLSFGGSDKSRRRKIQPTLSRFEELYLVDWKAALERRP